MKNLYRQTKQAFFFSLVFYVVALVSMLLKIGVGPVLFSVALLLSLIWVFLVLREIMLSTTLGNGERLFLVIFIFLTNIIGGAVYFFFLRDRVSPTRNMNK